MKIHAGRHSLPTNVETPAVSALEKSDKARHAQPLPTRSRQLRSANAKGSNIGDAGGAGGATGGACAIPACIRIGARKVPGKLVKFSYSSL